jgi:hypothetical protein
VKRLGFSPERLEAQPDTEADEQARRDQTDDGQVEQQSGSGKAPAERERSRNRDRRRQQAGGRSKRDRSGERHRNVRHLSRLDDIGKPSERHPHHGKCHAAIRPLKRQHVHHQHRAVEKEQVHPEQRRQGVESPRPALSGARLVALAADHHRDTLVT